MVSHFDCVKKKKADEMAKGKAGRIKTLAEKYPPSAPCTCEVCLSYCIRPGWWTVKEAGKAIEAGYGSRMMLEVAPEFTFGVLSPAFRGSERSVATNQYARNGCTFLRDDRCELYGTGYQPLECRFCHHGRAGLGIKCHADLEKDWKSPAGQVLVQRWIKQVEFIYRVF